MKSDVESGLPRMVAANSCQLLLEVGKLIAISVLWLGVSRVKTTLARYVFDHSFGSSTTSNGGIKS